MTFRLLNSAACSFVKDTKPIQEGVFPTSRQIRYTVTSLWLASLFLVAFCCLLLVASSAATSTRVESNRSTLDFMSQSRRIKTDVTLMKSGSRGKLRGTGTVLRSKQRPHRDMVFERIRILLFAHTHAYIILSSSFPWNTPRQYREVQDEQAHRRRVRCCLPH